MSLSNCWEVKKCGREVGGLKAAELGVCPAASETKANGINNGQNSVRAFWAIAGTLCGGVVQGFFASKLQNCMACDFYKMVLFAEGKNCAKSKDILRLL